MVGPWEARAQSKGGPDKLNPIPSLSSHFRESEAPKSGGFLEPLWDLRLPRFHSSHSASTVGTRVCWDPTWNLKRGPLQITVLFERALCRLHVSCANSKLPFGTLPARSVRVDLLEGHGQPTPRYPDLWEDPKK